MSNDDCECMEERPRGPTVDSLEHRLLAGYSSGSLELFDVDDAVVRVEDDDVDESLRNPSRRPTAPGARRRRTATRASREAPEELPARARVSSGYASSFGHRSAVKAVAWYPFDSGLCLSGGSDGKLCLWDVSRGLEGVSSVSFESPGEDSRSPGVLCVEARVPAVGGPLATVVAVGLVDGTLGLYDMRAGGATHRMACHQRGVLGVSWHPLNESLLATCGADGCVRTWDVRRGGVGSALTAMDSRRARPSLGASGGLEGNDRTAVAHSGGATAVGWARGFGCGRVLLSAGVDGYVRRWDAEGGWQEEGPCAGALIRRLRASGLGFLDSHSSATTGTGSIVLHGNVGSGAPGGGEARLVGDTSETGATSTGEGRVMAWNEGTCELLGNMHGGHVGSVLCLTTGGVSAPLVATGGDDGAIVLWESLFLTGAAVEVAHGDDWEGMDPATDAQATLEAVAHFVAAR
jgi:WD40 repeat protein